MDATQASLLLMGEGMGAIFIVMLLIFFSIKLLTRKKKDKKDK
jgi:Na+-transporting methylmalonyl-CoA/oxaloacetate decarboxylase gamma subunit